MGEGTTAPALLQRRAARFGLTLGAIVLAGLAVRGTAHLLLGNSLATFVSVSWFGHALAGLVLIGLWVTLRTREREPTLVEHLETGAVVVAAVCFQLVGLQLEPEARPDYVVLLSLFVILVGRAAFVPSTPWRTGLLSAGIGVPFLALLAWHLNTSHDPSAPAHAVWSRPLNAAVWWSIVTVICVVITRTIYGLREKVREARRLGQYQLEELIVVGGMGEIYRASHALLRRPTAVKLIKPDRMDERTAARFEQEAQLTASLSHPNTVTVYDYGRTNEGVFYYAMELIDGADLQTVVEVTGPMPPARVARLLAQVAGALSEAHRGGLIHRDVKPSNLLLMARDGQEDTMKVVDFGLVKNTRADESLSGAGSIVGTPLYLSPEAILTPNEADARSDLYSLGAVGFFLLTGRPPFEGDNPMAVFSQHVSVPPPPPAELIETPLDPMLERLLLQCLRKDPCERPQTAREVEVRLLDAVERLGHWDAYDSAVWWREHGTPVRQAAAQSGDMSPTTVTVAARP